MKVTVILKVFLRMENKRKRTEFEDGNLIHVGGFKDRIMGKENNIMKWTTPLLAFMEEWKTRRGKIFRMES